jgi:hypothetical protein
MLKRRDLDEIALQAWKDDGFELSAVSEAETVMFFAGLAESAKYFARMNEPCLAAHRAARGVRKVRGAK